MRTMTGLLAGALVFSLAGRAEARALGSGSGRSASTPPVTKSAGTAAEAAELPSRALLLAPRHGMFGAPGAAGDAAGPSRLGGGERAVGSSYGEGARGGAAGNEPQQDWRSGDRVRSWSSADVRAARGQQAPDLEWAGAARGGDARREPQEPYGVRFSIAQQPKAQR